MNQLDPDQMSQHRDRLCRVARALCRCPEEAEDLVQETYARVLMKARVLREEDSLGYLLRALRNTHTSEWRARQRRPATTALPDNLDLVEDRAALQPAEALEAAELRAAVASLSEPYRSVLVAVDMAGLSYREAARACDTREGTVMSRLFRARRQVAALLEAA